MPTRKNEVTGCEATLMKDDQFSAHCWNAEEKCRRLVTVTLNPAIDTMYRLDALRIGASNRTDAPLRTAGGKGLNVSRVARLLGAEVVATGFLGGNNGRWIREELAKLGIDDRFVEIAGETRVCLAFIDANGTQTEVLEKGPVIQPAEVEAFRHRLAEILAAGGVVVVSGSLPRGVSSELYRWIIRDASQRGSKVLLDTSGSALMDGLAERPYMIKPNRQELEQILGRSITTEREIWRALDHFYETYAVPLIVVSDGERGAFISLEGRHYKMSAAKVETVSAVGSGDAFVAGLAVGLVNGDTIEEALTLAAACGAANAAEPLTGYVNPEKVQELKKQIVWGTVPEF